MSKIRENKRFLTALQIIVAIAAYAYLGKRLASASFDGKFELAPETLPLLLAAVLLMPLNWLAEAQKWRILLGNVRFLSLTGALLAVIRGLPFGLITPYRFGEWFGRSVYLARPWQGTVSGFVGGYVQQLVTLSFGLAGVLVYFGAGKFFVISLAVLFVAVTGGFVMLKFVPRFFPGAGRVIDLGPDVYARAFLWAVVRYVIFSTQYVLFFRFFGINAPLAGLYVVVFVIYLSVNVLPLWSLADLGVRSNVAIWLLQAYGGAWNITAAGLAVWLLNVGLGAVIGGVLIIAGVFARENV